MPLSSMEIYTCAVCGNALAGLEWEEHSANLKDYKCPDCGHLLNEDELYGENKEDQNELS